jgi:hypothetical protein
MDLHHTKPGPQEFSDRDRMYFLPPHDEGRGRSARLKETHVPELFRLLLERIRWWGRGSRHCAGSKGGLGWWWGRGTAENILNLRGVRRSGHVQKVGLES